MAFWMIWGVLFLNVSAGIAVLSMASPMLQEIFAGRLIGLDDVPFNKLTPAQITAVATIAAGFVGLLSLFNIGGRFFWASISDKIGRKATYFIFFLLGIALYAVAPTLAHAGSKVLFVGAICVIISMYGGGFATVPAYLADIFGTKVRGRDPRTSSHRMVGGGRRRRGSHRPRARGADPRWCAEGAGLRYDDVYHGRAARRRIDLQRSGQAGRSEIADAANCRFRHSRDGPPHRRASAAAGCRVQRSSHGRSLRSPSRGGSGKPCRAQARS